jgi:hypothetical protein
MRYPFIPFAVVLTLLAPALASAQPPRIAQIEKVRVGFKPYNEQVNFGRYKVGLWTPVYVEITAGQNGLSEMPGEPPAWLKVETPDFEGVNTIYRCPVKIGPNETQTVVVYTKTGNMNGDIKVELHVGKRTIHSPPERPMAMELNSHVYLALGRRVTDLPAALRGKEDNQNQNNFQFQDETQRRAAVFEDNINLLPKQWFGYDGVDLIFLSPDDRAFLTKLAGSKEHLQALAHWVRRGGRLVIPVNRQTQELMSNILSHGAWQPPVPVVLPPQTAEKFAQPDRLMAVESWGEVHTPLPNPGDKPPVVAQLEPPGAGVLDWDVEARAGQGADSAPLIARMRYGLGQIVYFAFSLDDPAFAQWPARFEFLKKAVAKIGPRISQEVNQPQRRFGGQDNSDVTSQLFNALDNFDVQVIPFGVVAFFIFLYVIVVGPLEFFLLKYVFGRLEWTWITFPAIVVAVSVVAYFTAYALKGQDLKINKVDVVDIDLRTSVDGLRQPGPARIYGNTFMMILSPRIQSYTVGIEPNPAFWGNEAGAKPLSADLVSWMARPDPNDFGGMGRGGGQGFFRKPYYYGEQPPEPEVPKDETLPSGVTGVPIPVWMSKAFSAAWEADAKVPPVMADLFYHRHPVEGKDLKISGTLRSNLGVDLIDTWLIYGDRAYPIDNGLPAVKEGQPGLKLNLELQQARSITKTEWHAQGAGEERPPTGQGKYDPTAIVKEMLFFERLDNSKSQSNHSLRRFDFSWRLSEDSNAVGDRRSRLREAILVGRARFQDGNAETLTSSSSSQPVATKLWLGDLPESGRGRPTLAGTLHQDTFVRVILPVRPAGN